MIFDLTDDDRDALERIRVELGARSHAEVIRRLIRSSDPSSPSRGMPAGSLMSAAIRPKLTPKPGKPAAGNPATAAPSASVPFAGNITRKPMQKKAR